MKIKQQRGLITSWAHLGNYNSVDRVVIVFQSEQRIMQQGEYLGQFKVYSQKFDIGTPEWDYFLQLCGIKKLVKVQDLLHRELTIEVDTISNQLVGIKPQNLNWLVLDPLEAARQEIPKWISDNANVIYTGAQKAHKSSEGKNIKTVKVEKKIPVVIDMYIREMIGDIK